VPFSFAFQQVLTLETPFKRWSSLHCNFFAGLYVTLGIPRAISFLFFYFIVAIAVEFPPWEGETLLRLAEEKKREMPCNSKWVGQVFFLFFSTPFLIFILGCYITHCFFNSVLACFYSWFVAWQASHDEAPQCMTKFHDKNLQCCNTHMWMAKYALFIWANLVILVSTSIFTFRWLYWI
jgi:hypothetical protein